MRLLQELVQLHESVHTVPEVTSLDQLRGGDGEYLAGTVNVAGHVYLAGMKLERLPVKFGTVGGYFDCGGNRLVTLEGIPASVGKDFYCSGNRLVTLEGIPASVGGYFNCSNNQLTSLVGVHKILKRVDGLLYITRNKIKSGGIGLLLVEGLTKIVADQSAFGIINKYLGQGMKGVLRCQEELHDAEFEEYAKL